jgi:hypothetical protein
MTLDLINRNASFDCQDGLSSGVTWAGERDLLHYQVRIGIGSSTVDTALLRSQARFRRLRGLVTQPVSGIDKTQPRIKKKDKAEPSG